MKWHPWFTAGCLALLMGVGVAQEPPGPPPEGPDLATAPDDPWADSDRPGWRGGRDGWMGPPMMGGMHQRLSEEQIEQIMEVLREQSPDFAERMENLRETDPSSFQRFAGRMMPRISELLRLKQEDPQLYELKLKDWRLTKETFQMAYSIRQQRQTGEAPETRVEELKALIREHFQVRQQMRERELDQLEKRLKELREQLQNREEAKDELIQKRVEELTGDQKLPPW